MTIMPFFFIFFGDPRKSVVRVGDINDDEHARRMITVDNNLVCWREINDYVN